MNPTIPKGTPGAFLPGGTYLIDAMFGNNTRMLEKIIDKDLISIYEYNDPSLKAKHYLYISYMIDDSIYVDNIDLI